MSSHIYMCVSVVYLYIYRYISHEPKRFNLQIELLSLDCSYKNLKGVNF